MYCFVASISFVFWLCKIKLGGCFKSLFVPPLQHACTHFYANAVEQVPLPRLGLRLPLPLPPRHRHGVRFLEGFSAEEGKRESSRIYDISDRKQVLREKALLFTYTTSSGLLPCPEAASAYHLSILVPLQTAVFTPDHMPAFSCLLLRSTAVPFFV